MSPGSFKILCQADRITDSQDKQTTDNNPTRIQTDWTGFYLATNFEWLILFTDSFLTAYH